MDDLDIEFAIIDNENGSDIGLAFSTPLKFDKLNRVIVKLVRLIEKNEKIKIDSLNVVLSNDAELAKLNSTYRNIEGTTDVLTFNLTDDYCERDHNDVRPIESTGICGEIYVSADRVIAQARERFVEPKDEFLHLLAHGLLHLCGLMHEDDVSLKRILQKGENYISMAKNGD